MVVFDASVLIDLFNPRLAGPRKQRIDILMGDLGKQKIVIPAPAYIEFLTRAEKAREEYHSRIEASNTFRVEPLSKRASVECAILLEMVFSAKQKREITRAKLKFDWMIVAVAKTLKNRDLQRNAPAVDWLNRQPATCDSSRCCVRMLGSSMFLP